MARPQTKQYESWTMEAANTEAAGSGTLTRGMAILNFMLRAHQPMTLAEIAEAAKLDQSTTLRLLRSLEDLKKIIRVGHNKKYMCSPKALSPLPLLHPIEQLRREAAPLIFEFSTEVKTSVVFVIYLGTEILAVQVATSPGTLNPYYNAWLEGPLHASGSGKALLMSLPPAQRQDLLGKGPYRAYTEKTLTSWDALNTNLTKADARGYALVCDEFCLGLSAMSRNIRSCNGHISSCIVLTGHSRDFTPEWVNTSGTKLINLTQLLPMQVTSLSMIDTLSGH